MPTTYDLATLVALAPPGAGRVHLHLPGYQPGRKPRSQANAPLCGVFVYSDAEQAPVRTAAQWPSQRATWNGSGDAGDRYWCPPCLGRLMVLLGMVDEVISRAIVAIANGPEHDLTPTEDVGSVLLVGENPPAQTATGGSPTPEA